MSLFNSRRSISGPASHVPLVRGRLEGHLLPAISSEWDRVSYSTLSLLLRLILRPRCRSARRAAAHRADRTRGVKPLLVNIRRACGSIILVRAATAEQHGNAQDHVENEAIFHLFLLVERVAVKPAPVNNLLPVGAEKASRVLRWFRNTIEGMFRSR